MPLTYTPIATQTLSSAASSVTFSSISGSYTDLVLVTTAKNATGAQYRLQLSFNGDRGTSIYSVTKLTGNGTTATSSRATNATYGAILIGTIGSTNFDNAITHIMNYANTTTYKTVLSRGNETAAEVNAEAGLWRSTAAITSLTLDLETSINFSIGSTFSLYGIASSAVGAKATGGTIFNDGTYYYHAFTSSGTFTPSSTLSCDVLVVAGGGGGGSYSAGGGAGAGGLLGFTGQSISTAQTVTIGAGGTGSTVENVASTNGSNSVFGSLTAAVGGGSGGSGSDVSTAYWKAGGNGGAGGGGGGRQSIAGGTGTAGQGFDGGRASSTTTSGDGAGGGGGGVGVVGTTGGAATAGGNGGDGLGTYSSWLRASGSGVLNSGDGLYYIAGGGGGNGVGTGATQGTGGKGGGGAVGAAGVANTGSGGGATGAGQAGKSGGSGLVIVRYLV